MWSVYLRCVRHGQSLSVSEIHAGAEQSHQLLFVMSNVSLHDLHTRAQQALKRLNIDHCKTHTHQCQAYCLRNVLKKESQL